MYIPIICFIFFVYKAIKVWKKKGTNLAFSLYILYALSFIASAIMGFLIPHYCDNIKLVPTLYLILVLYIWLQSFDNNFDVSIKDLRTKGLAKLMLIFMIPTMLYFLYYFRIVVTSGLLFVDDNIRTLLRYERLLPDNPLNTFAVFISSLYFVNIYLFFYGIIEKWGWKYNVGLLISSFSFPLYCLCFFGRDGVVLWILNLIIIYLLFKKHLSKSKRRIVSRIIFIFVIITASILTFVSLNRFFSEDSDSERNLYGTLGYLGQQLGNFSDVFHVNFNYSSTLFPGFRGIFYRFLGIQYQSSNEVLVSEGLEDERFIFRYFVYTLFSGYGYLGGIMVSLIFSYIIKILTIQFKRSAFNYYFIIILLVYQIPMNGVFYYRQSVGRLDIGYAIGIIILMVVYRTKEVRRVRS